MAEDTIKLAFRVSSRLLLCHRFKDELGDPV